MAITSRMAQVVTTIICIFVWTTAAPAAADSELKIGLVTMSTTIGFGLAPNYGAVIMALEAIERESLLPGYTIRVLWRDGCNEREGLYGGVELFYRERVDVMFGPPCSTGAIPLGLLTSEWNLPHISWVSTSPELVDKTKFTTFGRTLGSFSKMGPLVLEVFKYFQWKRAVIIAEAPNAICEYAALAINDVLLANDGDVADYVTISRDISDDEIEEMWTKAKLLGRIILFCSTTQRERRFLLKAHDMGMTNGDYVFIFPKLFDTVIYEEAWMTGDGRDEDVKEAYETVLLVFFATLGDEELGDFYSEVFNKSQTNPFNMTAPTTLQKSVYAPYLHDAVYLYGLVANKTLEMGGNLRNGTLMFENMKRMKYKGKSGDVIMDNNAEREPGYWIKDLRPSGKFEIIIDVQVDEDGTRTLLKYADPLWGGDRTLPPLDTPPCGFLNELCPPDQTEKNLIIIISVVATVLIIFVVIILVLVYRRRKLEEELARMLWKVDFADIMFNKNRKFGSLTSSLSLLSYRSAANQRGISPTRSWTSEQKFTSIGVYKDKLVAVKYIKKDSIDTDRTCLLELKTLREMDHTNIAQFVGLCPDSPNICILTMYCSKGSLEDILANDDIKLDWLFKTSLLSDIVMGMEYLHESQLISHGRLKSSNCVIDSRWVLKITDYGLNSLREYNHLEYGEYALYSSLLWTAPELLRATPRIAKGSQKGDIYSFAIIIRETLTRSGPFDTDELTPQEIIEQVKRKSSAPFRPYIVMDPGSTRQQTDIAFLMEESWDEDPNRRPTFKEIRYKLKQITQGKNTNIMDNILNMMEKYANNLEEIVEERTQQLLEEKKKTDRLLYSMLPRSVADQLKSGRRVDPETYDQVTIFFSDIVGFTRVCSESTPMQVVDMLNDLYTMFDDSILHFNVYKVETIGDAYMVVSGLPKRNGKEHAGVIADMALDLLSNVTTFKLKHQPDRQLQLRIGIHSGPCVAGVVGLTMPRYCLFGDTVNIASRMESNGKGLRIQLSETTCRALEDLGGYHMHLRGVVNVKGKGKMTTYWLEGKDGFNKPLPKQSISMGDQGGEYQDDVI